MYKLTEVGREKIRKYLREMEAKRKEILDAGLDTSDETRLPTEDEIFEDVISFGVDVNGDAFDCFGVTDNYNADDCICLTLGIDFVEDENWEEMGYVEFK